MITKGDKPRPFQIVSVGGGEGQVPGHWPLCPAYLSEAQRVRFWGVCSRLDEQGTLESADVGKIEALAIAEDNLEVATTVVNAGGKYATVTKQGRPYQCPACKGSGLRPRPKGGSAAGPEAAAVASPHKPPGRPCSVCTHPDRAEIDADLGRGIAFRKVSERWGISTTAAYRHKQEHLGKPSKPTLADPDDRTCLGCAGKGVIMPETHEVTEKRPETTDQRYAIDQVAKLSAQLGLDVTSRVRVKGRPAERKGPSGLQELMNRRANLRK